jgi:hypothetical protein
LIEGASSKFDGRLKMKVFISWSGERSKAMAEALREWLEIVFPSSVEPWMSTTDLGKGRDWRKELERQLTGTDAGIVCVTPENLNPSWMLYEVGFLSKGVEEAFVVPYLLGVNINELKGPLEQFQAVEAQKEDTKKLVETINNALGKNRVDSKALDRRFEVLWSALEQRLKDLPLADVKACSQETMRGITLEEAITGVGLVDIENRNDRRERVLPPEKFYELAKREIVITGVSAYRTFEEQVDVIREALRTGKKLRVLILHPNAPAIERLSNIENPPVKHDIAAVIEIIKRPRNKFHENPNFQIKFMQEMPPFTAVMIDGDVSPVDSEPQDQEGQIRVQPRAEYGTQHRGVILQFKKIMATTDQAPGPFDYFAEDVRNQWRWHGKEYPELFAK